MHLSIYLKILSRVFANRRMFCQWFIFHLKWDFNQNHFIDFSHLKISEYVEKKGVNTLVKCYIIYYRLCKI